MGTNTNNNAQVGDSVNASDMTGPKYHITFTHDQMVAVRDIISEARDAWENGNRTFWGTTEEFIYDQLWMILPTESEG